MGANTVFIVGAGFSLDANALVDPSDAAYTRGYPLTSELATACFTDAYDLARGVEWAFGEALKRADPEPVRRLIDLIRAADHYIGARVARAQESAYTALIDHFHPKAFLSFNYDALVELLLHQRRLWTPYDGFGVPCKADVDQSYVQAPAVVEHSKVQVLHLHGSVYIYPLEFEEYEANPGKRSATAIRWIRETSSVEFHFDPDAIAHDFVPFRGGAADMRYKHPDERVIVPTPEKSSGLRGRFSKAIFDSALWHLESATQCIAVGYRFADCDANSFRPLLRAVARGPSKRLFVIAPDAVDIRARLHHEAGPVEVVAVDASFRQWSAEGFRL